MKIIGWLITLLGSNFLTATVVAKYFYIKIDETVNETIIAAGDWTLENLGDFVGGIIDNGIGKIPFFSSVGDSVAGIINENISEGLSEFIKGFHGITEQIDISGRSAADMLFYVALAVLISGLIVLITAYIKKPKGREGQ